MVFGAGIDTQSEFVVGFSVHRTRSKQQTVDVCEYSFVGKRNLFHHFFFHFRIGEIEFLFHFASTAIAEASHLAI